MSTFDGQIREFPWLAIDNFRCRKHVRFYLLSHVHTDHLDGLDSRRFEGVIYCSAATARLLPQLLTKRQRGVRTVDGRPVVPRFAHLVDKLHPLEIEQPSTIGDEPKTVTVTLIPANHCPGAVMILLEGAGADASPCNVLYTGDFRAERWYTDQIRKNSPLVMPSGDMKRISTLYLDTTFANPGFRSLPTKRQAIERIEHYILEDLPPHVQIHLECYMLGYEDLWIALRHRFKQKIHVSEYSYALYKSIKDLSDHYEEIFESITIDHESTRFHACADDHGKPCRVPFDSRSVQLKPSALWFARMEFDAKVPERQDECPADKASVIGQMENRLRLAYSMHSSLQELQEFVSVVKPDNVHPCVLNQNSLTFQTVIPLLEPYLSHRWRQSCPLRPSFGRNSQRGTGGAWGQVMITSTHSPAPRKSALITPGNGCNFSCREEKTTAIYLSTVDTQENGSSSDDDMESTQPMDEDGRLEQFSLLESPADQNIATAVCETEVIVVDDGESDEGRMLTMDCDIPGLDADLFRNSASVDRSIREFIVIESDDSQDRVMPLSCERSSPDFLVDSPRPGSPSATPPARTWTPPVGVDSTPRLACCRPDSGERVVVTSDSEDGLSCATSK